MASQFFIGDSDAESHCSSHCSSNSSCDCRMCCGRDGYDVLSDDDDHCRQCHDMRLALVHSERDCSYWQNRAENATEALEKIQDELQRTQDELQATQFTLQVRQEELDNVNVNAVPPPPPETHRSWLAAMLTLWNRLFHPLPAEVERQPPCSWHGPAQLNVVSLRVVVNEYNVVKDDADLWNLFQAIENHQVLESQFDSFEKTLFRTNRLSWYALQEKIRQYWSWGKVAVLRSHSPNKKWFLATCPCCGDCVFVPYKGSGATTTPEDIDTEYRHELYRFFNVPIPDPNGVREV